MREITKTLLLIPCLFLVSCVNNKKNDAIEKENSSLKTILENTKSELENTKSELEKVQQQELKSINRIRQQKEIFKTIIIKSLTHAGYYPIKVVETVSFDFPNNYLAKLLQEKGVLETYYGNNYNDYIKMIRPTSKGEDLVEYRLIYYGDYGTKDKVLSWDLLSHEDKINEITSIKFSSDSTKVFIEFDFKIIKTTIVGEVQDNYIDEIICCGTAELINKNGVWNIKNERDWLKKYKLVHKKIKN